MNGFQVTGQVFDGAERRFSAGGLSIKTLGRENDLSTLSSSKEALDNNGAEKNLAPKYLD